MKTYYAVCNVSGPISVSVMAASVDAAVEQFAKLATRQLIDECKTDAEDDLDICGDGMTEDEFSESLIAAGCKVASDLDQIVNGHTMRAAHLQNGWTLWSDS